MPGDRGAPGQASFQMQQGLKANCAREAFNETLYLFGYIRHTEQQKCVILKYKGNTDVI